MAGILLLLVMPVTPTASAGGKFYFPNANWSAFWGANPRSGGPCGGNPVYVSPHAYPSDGKVVMDTASWAMWCGAYSIDAWAGFWSTGFTVPSDGNRKITFAWRISWDAYVATGVCWFGATVGEGQIRFGANVFDESAYAWKLNSDAVRFVWNTGTLRCGLSSASSQDDAYYFVTFDAYLFAGHTYKFYTYLYSHTLAGATGTGAADARNNIGSSGDFAQLRYVYVR
ncbi:MAG: hypothetical protein HY557_01680 [Euryarchaeota archaeon]|nr:hypothetical protein [Euryarchaeota archaeon]